jgi:hypothetical protein
VFSRLLGLLVRSIFSETVSIELWENSSEVYVNNMMRRIFVSTGSVGKATRLRAERPRNRDSIPCMGNITSIKSKSALEPVKPPTQWVPGVYSPRVKRQGCDADHSLQNSAEVKNSAATPLFRHMSSWRDA